MLLFYYLAAGGICAAMTNIYAILFFRYLGWYVFLCWMSWTARVNRFVLSINHQHFLIITGFGLALPVEASPPLLVWYGLRRIGMHFFRLGILLVLYHISYTMLQFTCTCISSSYIIATYTTGGAFKEYMGMVLKHTYDMICYVYMYEHGGGGG